jgi:hypothetical protein
MINPIISTRTRTLPSILTGPSHRPWQGSEWMAEALSQHRDLVDVYGQLAHFKRRSNTAGIVTRYSTC